MVGKEIRQKTDQQHRSTWTKNTALISVNRKQVICTHVNGYATVTVERCTPVQ